MHTSDLPPHRHRLAYRLPFDWTHLRGFLDARAIDGVESIDGDAYRRVVALPGAVTGWLGARPLPLPVGSDVAADAAADAGARAGADAGAPADPRPGTDAAGGPGDGFGLLEVELSAGLAAHADDCLRRLRRLFDADAVPRDIAAVLGPLAHGQEGVRLPGAFDGFELAVRAILGQQITVKAARTLAGRFAARFGEPVATPFAGLARAFPSAPTIAALDVGDIAPLGIIASRARSIIAVARAIADGALRLDPASPPADTIALLRTLPGIGDWTAQYIAMRALACADAFPAGDLIVRRCLGVPTAAAALARAASWQPWRAYAVMHLWKRGPGWIDAQACVVPPAAPSMAAAESFTPAQTR